MASQNLESSPLEKGTSPEYGIRSLCSIPLHISDGCWGQWLTFCVIWKTINIFRDLGNSIRVDEQLSRLQISLYLIYMSL